MRTGHLTLKPLLELSFAAELFVGTILQAGDERFIRGDVRPDTKINLSDAVYLLKSLFLEDGPLLECEDGADVNDDGTVDLGDPLHLLFYLYAGGNPPREPFPFCGSDPPFDHLACSRYLPCGTPSEITNITNIAAMKLVFVPPGSFWMGSPPTERGRGELPGLADETLHKVNISCGFYVSTTEVTQGQYKSITGANPSYYDGPPFGIDLERPVEMVSWFDCTKFCTLLSQKEGLDYRLPTEAEWECACRAGTTTRFSFGDALDCEDFCNSCPLAEEFSWFCQETIPMRAVGLKKPNDFGLHDMHGLVAEWCRDWYAPYPTFEVTDPRGPSTGSRRIFRGDGWLMLKAGRSAWRAAGDPTDSKGPNVGFRVVLSFCTLGSG